MGEAALVAPGFIHPGKGFDRAVVAFRDAGSGGRLYIVGSVKDPIPKNVAHARLLRELAAHVLGVEIVDLIVTELAVIEVTPQGLVLREVAPGVTSDDVQKVTEPRLRIALQLKTIAV